MVGGEFQGLDERITIAVAQPLRTRKASLLVNVPHEEVADGVVNYKEETINLSPRGQETRLQLMYETSGDGVSVAAGGYVRLDPEHAASAGTEYGIGAKLAMRF